VVSVAAVAVVLGHLFPVWLRFKGGKGIATALGVLLALHWPVALVAGAVWLFVTAIFRISSLSSLCAAIAAPLYAVFVGKPELTIPVLIIAVLVFIMHRANIARLLRGEEPRIGAKKTAA
jgi:glycerol-3-phosphate acyltransferase PlsY